MTKQPNDTAPDLIVVGLQEGQPRAAKFPAGQPDLVGKAAKAMNLTVCKAEGPARRMLKVSQGGPGWRDSKIIAGFGHQGVDALPRAQALVEEGSKWC